MMNNAGKIHALLVDDDIFVRQSIELALASQGVKVSVADSAMESFPLIEKTKFDLAIIDIGMPDINGIELCQKIRAMDHIHQFPILILSGYGDKKTEMAARHAGANEFLTKPFSLQAMVALIRKYEAKGN